MNPDAQHGSSSSAPNYENFSRGLSFAPAGKSTTSLTDLIGLDELFDDNFFPPELDFNQMFNPNPLNEGQSRGVNQTSSGQYMMDADFLIGMDSGDLPYNNNYAQNSDSSGAMQGMKQFPPDMLRSSGSGSRTAATYNDFACNEQQRFAPLQMNNAPSSSTASSSGSQYASLGQSGRRDSSSGSSSSVIMIPPSMPQHPPSMPGNRTIKSIQSSGSGKVDVKKERKDGTMTSLGSTTGIRQEAVRRDSGVFSSSAGASASAMESSKRARKDGADSEDDSKDLTESQRVERRERNREHAKRSRIRKRVLLDALQDQLTLVRNENIKLRRLVSTRIPHLAGKILAECTKEESELLLENRADEDDGTQGTKNLFKPSPITSNISIGSAILSKHTAGAASSVRPTIGLPKMKQHAKILMEPDYRLIESLITSQQNFVLSDPSLPDNPIVYASEGFCKLTGYKRQDILGRNCRFLQGPGTDQAAVDIIRKGVAEGRDISVCLLNYKADKTPFWNQFFVGALRDADGAIVNYVGIQCEVNTLPITGMKERVKKLPIPTDF